MYSRYAVSFANGAILIRRGPAWSTKAPVMTPNSLNAVTFGQDRFVAVGKSGTILYSDDGEKWTVADSGVPNDLTSIAYGKEQFIATGLEKILC